MEKSVEKREYRREKKRQEKGEIKKDVYCVMMEKWEEKGEKRFEWE